MIYVLCPACMMIHEEQTFGARKGEEVQPAGGYSAHYYFMCPTKDVPIFLALQVTMNQPKV